MCDRAMSIPDLQYMTVAVKSSWIDCLIAIVKGLADHSTSHRMFKSSNAAII